MIDEIDLMHDESEHKIKELADSLKPFLTRLGTDWKPVVHYEVGLGALAYQVDRIIAEKDIEMVVMGEREGSAMDHFLTGSETYAVIDHSSRPVLIIPMDADLSRVRKVIFATDFSEADIKAIHYLIKLGFLLNYHLEIVHINLLGENDISKNLRKAEFMKHINRLKYDHIQIKEVYGKDVIDRLNKLCEASGNGMLSFTHYRNSFLSRFFSTSVTKKALANQKIPMIVFPAKFAE